MPSRHVTFSVLLVAVAIDANFLTACQPATPDFLMMAALGNREVVGA